MTIWLASCLSSVAFLSCRVNWQTCRNSQFIFNFHVYELIQKWNFMLQCIKMNNNILPLNDIMSYMSEFISQPCNEISYGGFLCSVHVVYQTKSWRSSSQCNDDTFQGRRLSHLLFFTLLSLVNIHLSMQQHQWWYFPHWMTYLMHNWFNITAVQWNINWWLGFFLFVFNLNTYLFLKNS